MRYLLLAALLAEFSPPLAHARESPGGIETPSARAPRLSVLRWIAMLIWVCIAIHPNEPAKATRVPF
jgi:hypothetical protein